VKCGNCQTIARLKGVSDDFLACDEIAGFITGGEFLLHKGNKNCAIIGEGVGYSLNVNFGDDFYLLELFYPKSARAFMLSSMYRKKTISIGGIASIDRNFDDNYVVVPLKFARDLMLRESEIDGIEIYVKDKSKTGVNSVKQALIGVLPDSFRVLDSYELNVSLFKAMKVEHMFLMIVLMCILGMAALNMFSIVSMFIIKKQEDIKTLLMLGANGNTIKWIFLLNGGFIAFLGGLIGAIISFVLCLLQERYGFISLGFDSPFIDRYPVKICLSDYVYTVGFIILMCCVVSYGPSKRAAESFSRV
jgi:lipoprotein-releasing system permease protein